MKFKAAIVGLGNIGQGYDYESKDNTSVLTHAKAYATQGDFEIVGGVDPSSTVCKKFEAHYHSPTFATVAGLFKNQKVDVVSICVPTDKHFSVFKEVLSHTPKAIVCEKPLSLNSAEAKEICTLAKKAKVSLLVNYMRRFEPGVLSLKKMIDEGFFGTLIQGNCYYYGGFYNNASHMIDLYQFLLGSGHSPKLIQNKNSQKNSDPELDFKITFGKTEVIFFHSPIKEYSLYESEIFGTNGSFKFLNGGEKILYRQVGLDSLFPGYNSLLCEEKPIPTFTNNYQLHVFNALCHHLADDTKLNSTGDTALETLILMDMIKKDL